MTISKTLTTYILLPNWTKTLIFLCFYFIIGTILQSPAECLDICVKFPYLNIKPVGSIITYEPINIYTRIPFYMAGDYDLVIAQQKDEIKYLNYINTNHFVMFCTALFIVYIKYTTR